MVQGSANVVLGVQWGDEGKGKLVDIIASEHDIVARCGGGANAGHTIVDEQGKKFALHLVPSGILKENCVNVIGNGCVVHMPALLKELRTLKEQGVDYHGRLLLSDRAHLLFSFHMTVDGLLEERLGSGKIGTTKRGIGPCYSTKALRSGVRIGDLLEWEHFEKMLRNLAHSMETLYQIKVDVEEELRCHKECVSELGECITDTVDYLNTALESGKKILVEGANATMLDIDFGTYPFVTSSNPSVGGSITGLGISPGYIKNVYAVCKAYATRVGSGVFPTQDEGQAATHMQQVGREFGTTTGRPRRCGWLDLVALLYTKKVNGFTHLNITKLDVLTGLQDIQVGVAYYDGDKKLPSFPASIATLERVRVEYKTFRGWSQDISQVRKYDDLPQEARDLISFIEEYTKTPVAWIGVGPARDAQVTKTPL